MTEANTDNETYTAEIIKAEYTEGSEFEFRANIRVKIHNPHGEDVSVYWTYLAGPKYDDLVKNEGHVQRHGEYWWPDAIPANGDNPLTDQQNDWRPNADLDDHDALLEECKINATLEPEVQIEFLKNQNDHIKQKLQNYTPDVLLSKDEFTDMGWPGDIDKVNSGADRIRMIATSLADTGIMDMKEAQAFAFHEIAGVSLQRTADETGKSTSEIKRGLRSASRKVSHAREFVEILDDCNC